MTSKYVIQSLQDPPMPSAEFRRIYDGFARRVLWMDGNVVDGAFQMNTAWYYRVPEKNPIFEEHVHPCSELIGFLSGDPEQPCRLGGELELWMQGERHLLTRSTMIFVPAGMPHMPLVIHRIDRPIFHFSVMMDAVYDSAAYAGP